MPDADFVAWRRRQLAAGAPVRTTGDQTFSGAATSTGMVTVQAGPGSIVRFLGDVSLGGLVPGVDGGAVGWVLRTVVTRFVR